MEIQELFNLAQSLDKSLITSEIYKPNDYYGHATVIKKYAQIKPEYSLKVILEHGIILHANLKRKDEVQSPLPVYITMGLERRNYLQKHLNKTFFAIGPFIHYATEIKSFNEKINSRKNLLFFPAHSTHHIKAKYDTSQLCRVIENLGREFDNVIVCLYWKDILDGIAQEYIRRGYACVTAGHMYDPLFLPRLKGFINSSTLTASNLPGTHTGYCVALGKPHILIDQNIEFSWKPGVDAPPYNKLNTNPEYLKIKKAFARRHDTITPEQKILVNKHWGTEEIKTPDELNTILNIAEEMSDKESSSFKTKNKTATFHKPDNPSILTNVEIFLRQGEQKLNEGNIELAFNYFNKAKAAKTPIKGLDYLRALCFQKMNQMDAVRETLREELRFFPDNQDAKALLQLIISKQQNQQSVITFNDEEFCLLLKTIRPYTMVGDKRLFSLFTLAKKVCIEDIAGNFVECGVAAGGSTALLAYVIKKYSKRPRTLFAFDSFEGMPKPTDEDHHKGVAAESTGWGTGTCSAPEESVREICKKLEVLDIVKTVKGYFQDTLPEIRSSIGDIAFLHMDGDWYESTKSILENTYDIVVNKGIIQADDYGHWDGCKKAIHEFETRSGIIFDKSHIDYSGIWFTKQDKTASHSSNLHNLPILNSIGTSSQEHINPSVYKVKPLNVVHISAFESGGAGIAAYRLHKGLQQLGINSTMLVAVKTSCDPSVKVLPDKTIFYPTECLSDGKHTSKLWIEQKRRWKNMLKNYPHYDQTIEIFTDSSSFFQLGLLKEVQEADVINFHWIAGLVDYQKLPGQLRNKPIVWTLHDMNPFTGGCHYTSDCKHFEKSCGNCAILGSSQKNDHSSGTWMEKNSAYTSFNINIVTPSKWLKNCVKKSSLLSKNDISVIPYGLDTKIFKPGDKEKVRSDLNIPKDSRVILFGAVNILNKRKGIHYLLEALNKLSMDNIVLLCFGNISKDNNLIEKYQCIQLGSLKNNHEITMAYNAADIFVLPSLEDNLPNTVLESLACGTPVVGFNIGGVPDMIVHKKTGYLAKEKDIDSLVDGIKWTLLSNTEVISRNCRNKAITEYNSNIQANRYIELYQNILSTRSENTLKTVSSHGSPTDLPMISIVTPSFNQGGYIEKTIQSILNQNYPNLEYIIIDGGSSDNSIDIIKRYEKHLTYWVSEKDNGQSHTINKGLKKCTGQMFNWINSDDYLEPGALHKISGAYFQNPESAGWIGACKLIDDHGKYLYSVFPNGIDREIIGNNWNGHQFYQPACFLNLNKVRKLNGINEDLHYGMDLELYLRITEKDSFTILPGIVANSARQADAKTVKNIDQSYIEAAYIKQRFGFHAGAQHRLARRFGKTKMKFIPPDNSPSNPAGSISSFYSRKHILCPGNFNNNACLKATIHFIKNIFPGIQAHIRDIELHITGKNCDKIRNLLTVPALSIIPDTVALKSIADRYKLLVSPTANGYDPSEDIVTAANAGLPIVTTSQAAAPLSLQDGHECFIADNNWEFTEKSILCLINPTVWGYFNYELTCNHISKTSKLSKIKDGSDLASSSLVNTLASTLPLVSKQDTFVTCPICSGRFKQFLPFGLSQRPNVLCPECKSLERHRLLWLYLQQKTDFFKKNLKVLDIAPMPGLSQKYQETSNIDYLSIDLNSPLAMAHMDITQLSLDDNSFDCLLCYHVLEHIPDDRKAISELYRVLKPGGWAIIQVPINPKLSKTLEDPTITDSVIREQLFGNKNHVRYYGLDYKDRLEQAGFKVTVDKFLDNMSEEDIQRYRLKKSEEIYLCIKPKLNTMITAEETIMQIKSESKSFENIAAFYRRTGNQDKAFQYEQLAKKAV